MEGSLKVPNAVTYASMGCYTVRTEISFNEEFKMDWALVEILKLQGKGTYPALIRTLYDGPLDGSQKA